MAQLAYIQEQALLLNVCKNECGDDLEKGKEDFFCIQDMLNIQKMQSIITNFSRTKSGRIRKGSEYYNLLDNRLNELV